MKKKLIFFILLAQITFSQKVKLDFAINIDGTTESIIYDAKIKLGETEIQIEYHPGNLQMENEDFEKIKNNETCLLKFITVNKTSYEFELDSNWFYSEYIILDIFNMSNRQSKKKFKPLPKKNYTFFMTNGIRSILPISR